MLKLLAAGAATLSLALAAPALAGPAPAPRASTATAPQFQLAHISVRQLGNRGSPVILIPGMGTPRSVWDAIAPRLARRHRVYLVQVNGFGSDDPRANLGQQLLPGIVGELQGFIAAQHLHKPAVIGHSMGGLAAMMLAIRDPGAVGRLLVVDALPFFSVLAAPPGSEVSAQSIEPLAARMKAGIQATYGKPLDPAILEAQTQGLALSAPAQALLRGWATGADARVTGQLIYEDMTTDLRPLLPDLKVPTTVIYPWHDGAFKREETAAFYRRQFAGAPQIGFVEITGAAHFVMLDQPAPFAAAVDKFLGD